MSTLRLQRTSVGDVMSTDVVSVDPDTPFERVARLLIDRRVRAVPVLDIGGHVLGVVSQADLARVAERRGPDDPIARERWWWRADEAEPLTACELMTSPVVSVRPQESVAGAARLMHQHGIGWLAVVDGPGTGHLVGVLGRSDVLKTFLRPDSELRAEIVHAVLHPVLLGGARTIRVDVDQGVVTLAGRVRRRADADAAVALVDRLEGVVGVVDQLVCLDDQPRSGSSGPDATAMAHPPTSDEGDRS